MSDLYVGKVIEPSGHPGPRYLHRLADLTTHTFICGGSGSGKTVVGKAIIEEAARQGVPAILVDLKGDLSSLALSFSEISTEMLAPWITVEDGASLGRAALAEANSLRRRLQDWGLAEADVRGFSESVAVEVFTPRGDAGRRVAIPLVSAPPPDLQQLVADDPDSAVVMVTSMAEALVRRVIPSGRGDREVEFVTALIDYAWRHNLDLTGVQGLQQLVGMILEPPFETIGVLAVEDHLPEKRRQKLAQSVNGQLVGADATWLRGEDLSIDKLAGTNRTDGRTQISVLNVSHLTNFEDQSFVVAQVAFAINAWMRRQGSAPSGERPRLLFFLDEIGGGGGKTAFYPTYPYTSTCKPALNLLDKQGRAFGVGCLLATQNPGDIDYKGISNCATWIVGKLQTRRDRDKIREGLTDAEFSPADLTKRLARPKTGQFMFLTKAGDVAFVQERWLLTYHCTLSPDQLLRLKREGLRPYEGDLDTAIAMPESTEDAQPLSVELESRWNDVREAVGTAQRLLEKITKDDPSDGMARKWLTVVRDPEGCYRQAFERPVPSADQQNHAHTEDSRETVLDLLSKAPERTTGLGGATVTPTGSANVSAAGQDSDAVGDDGNVTYRGRQFQLYRRYAGKPVTFIEEDGQLRFSIEGRVLSKTYPL
jgi:hypothetical protein